MATEPTDVTQRITKELRAVARGDHDAFERLVELVYHDLRQLAHVQLSRRPTSMTESFLVMPMRSQKSRMAAAG